jgi:hypothetical protein
MDSNALSQFLIQSMINAQTVKWSMIILLGAPTLITALKMWLPYHWLWLGNWRKIIPPGLGVVTICLVIHPFNLVNVLIGFSTGVGSMGLHEFVSVFRSIPTVENFFAKFEPKLDANGNPIVQVFGSAAPAAQNQAAAAAPAAPSNSSGQPPAGPNNV